MPREHQLKIQRFEYKPRLTFVIVLQTTGDGHDRHQQKIDLPQKPALLVGVNFFALVRFHDVLSNV